MKKNDKQIVDVLLDSLKEHEVENPKRGAYAIQTVQVVNFILEDCQSVFRLIDNQYRVYEGRYWKALESHDLNDFLRAAAIKYGVSTERANHFNFTDALLKQLKAMAKPWMATNSDGIYINMLNGVLDLSQNKPVLIEHKPSLNLTHLMSYEYAPGAQSPLFDQFLKKVLPNPETQNALLEGVAAAFIPPSRFKLEKAMLCYGSGANGKSVFFDIIEALFGHDNMSFYSLAELTDKRGSHRVQVQGKLINYSSEGERDFNAAIFKQLVSKEPTSGELKYENPIVLKAHPQIVINTNVIPALFEGSDGLLRRLLVIPFRVKIPVGEQDKQLALKIKATELPGVLNKVIDAAARLIEKEGFSSSSEVEDLMKEIVAESNNVRAFIDECKVACSTVSLKSQFLFEKYRDFCYRNGFRNIRSKQSFNRALEEYGFEKRKKSDGIHFQVDGEFPIIPSSSAQSS